MHELCTLGVVAAMVLAAHDAMAQPQCPGDFNGDIEVTVDEIIGSVNHALNGCPVRFTDNGDGTISDTWTGLVWEKKSDDGSVHDWQDTYTWSSGAPFDPDGTVFTEFLATLNDTVFAGYSDWRLPTVGELRDIVDYDRNDPAIDPVFHSNCEAGCTVTTCSCTLSSNYWSSTNFVSGPNNAWTVVLGNGSVPFNFKGGNHSVRAVRGGP